jgi:transcriptional regulator with XRE-family HTH domain
MARRNLVQLYGKGGLAYATLVGSAHGTMHAALKAEERHGLVTKAELARRLGISPSRLSRILSNQGNMELRTLGAVLGALGYIADIKAVRHAPPPGQPSNHALRPAATAQASATIDAPGIVPRKGDPMRLVSDTVV